MVIRQAAEMELFLSVEHGMSDWGDRRAPLPPNPDLGPVPAGVR